MTNIKYSKLSKILNDEICDNLKKSDLFYKNNAIFRGVYKAIKPIINELNNSKKVADDLLKNGIYPSNVYFINYNKYLALKKEKAKCAVDYAFECIRESITTDSINKISKYFKENNIKVAYKLYKSCKKENLRLCILSLIQTYNYLCNKKFGGISGEERIKISEYLNKVICSEKENIEDLKNKLKSDNRDIKDKEAENLAREQYRENTLKNGIAWVDYYLFYAFICENKNSALMTNKRELYLEYLYNRNSIIHGYNNEFGTEENCLRWFSAIFNLYDVMQIYDEFLELRGEVNE